MDPVALIVTALAEGTALEPRDTSATALQGAYASLWARVRKRLAGLPDGAHAYFVHSYELVTERASDTLARTDYGGPVTAAVGRDNLIGVQFHPEKSQAIGLALLGNFLGWRP